MAIFPFISVPSQPVPLTTATAITLYAWGASSSGQLGGNTQSNQSTPVAVSDFLSGKSFASIAPGTSHNVALDTEGNIWTWGDNTYGQLGNN